MQIYPLMNIRFPETSEADLIEAMKNRATPPWRWQQLEPHGNRVEEYSYFHRDAVGSDPACTLCLYREGPGNFAVVNIVPDAHTVDRISIDQYVGILREFDRLIAEPAADGLGGITSIETDKRSLEDYFSAEAIRLLERFCSTSNASDLGSHPSDQEKWMAFLVHVYRTNTDVDCDTFGACLQAKEWWPEEDVPRLVGEYDFALRLLRQPDRTPRKDA